MTVQKYEGLQNLGANRHKYRRLPAIINFFRRYSRDISKEEKFFAGMAPFVFLHERRFQIDRMLDLMETGILPEEQLNSILNNFIKNGRFLETDRLTKEQIKSRIIEATKRMTDAYHNAKQ